MGKGILLLVIMVWLALQAGAAPAVALTIDDESNPGRTLSTSELVELQMRLNYLGHDLGTPDGVIGGKTRAAWRAYRKRHQLEPGMTLGGLNHLRGKTAFTLGLDNLPPCEDGPYQEGRFNYKAQASQVWGAKLSEDLVRTRRNEATWAEVGCLDADRVRDVQSYHLGQPSGGTEFSYAGASRTPSMLRYLNADGNLTATFVLGRTAQGALTHIKAFGASGEPTRHVVVLGKGDTAEWTFLSADGAVNSRRINRYTDRGDLTTNTHITSKGRRYRDPLRLPL